MKIVIVRLWKGGNQEHIFIITHVGMGWVISWVCDCVCLCVHALK